MGFGQPLMSSTRYETLGGSVGSGVTVTSNTTANTKGAPTTIGTASFDYDGFYLCFGQASPARWRIDVIANTGGADIVIVADLCLDTTGAGGLDIATVLVPVRVPAGAVIKLRAQTSAVSQTFVATIMGFQGDNNQTLGFRGAISCTDWTNADPTNSVALTGNTFTAPTTVQASTTAAIAAFYATVSYRGTAPTATNLLINVCIGASGSELILATLFTRVAGFPRLPIGPFPCAIRAGTRLSFQAQASVNTITQTISVAICGIAA